MATPPLAPIPVELFADLFGGLPSRREVEALEDLLLRERWGDPVTVSDADLAKQARAQAFAAAPRVEEWTPEIERLPMAWEDHEE